MSYELFIGLRYLKAKRKQSFISVITFISIFGIMIGVMALIIVLSVMTGFEEDLREKILGVNSHMVVMELGSGMEEYEAIAGKIRGVPDVTGASAYVYGQAMISRGGAVTGAVIRGIDPATIGDVSVLPRRMKEGTLEGVNVPFGDESGRLPGIVIGAELSKTLGVYQGDELKVISPQGTMSAAGSLPRVAAFEVAGIFEMGMYEYDSNMAFISLENAQKFFKLGESVNGIEVKIKDIYEVESVSEDVLALLDGPYWVRSWKEMNKNLFSALKLEKVAMFIILTLIIIVAALNIISTLIMVVMEKGKDIAILKSMGATNGSIMKIFMVEGLIIGVIGTFLGTFVGVVCALKLEAMVSFIEGVFNFQVLPPSVYYIDRLPSHVEPSVVMLIAGLSVMISFVATLYPSWQASRLEPVEGLRYE